MLKQIIAYRSTGKFDPSAGLPTRLLVAPWGDHQTNKGRVVVNHTTLERLSANQAAAKFDRVALDFQHNTVPGEDGRAPEPAKVAAYGVPEVIEGEGIYLTALEWTAEGREHAEGGHYPDISPAVVRNDAGEVVFLHSAAICRQGEIDGVTLFSAAGLDLAALDATTPTQTTEKENTMFRQLVITLLGALGHTIPEDATDEDIQRAAQDFADARAAEAKPKEGEDAPAEEPPAIAALRAEIDSLRTRIDQSAAASDASARQAQIDRATREGKVVPLSADQIAALPVDTLSALVDGLPVTVPVERRTPDKVETFRADGGLTAADREVAARLGITEDKLKAVAARH